MYSQNETLQPQRQPHWRGNVPLYFVHIQVQRYCRREQPPAEAAVEVPESRRRTSGRGLARRHHSGSLVKGGLPVLYCGYRF